MRSGGASTSDAEVGEASRAGGALEGEARALPLVCCENGNCYIGLHSPLSR